MQEGHEDYMAHGGHDGEPKVAWPEVVGEELEAENSRHDEEECGEEVIEGEPEPHGVLLVLPVQTLLDFVTTPGHISNSHKIACHRIR